MYQILHTIYYLLFTIHYLLDTMFYIRCSIWNMYYIALYLISGYWRSGPMSAPRGLLVMIPNVSLKGGALRCGTTVSSTSVPRSRFTVSTHMSMIQLISRAPFGRLARCPKINGAIPSAVSMVMHRAICRAVHKAIW